jgi:hypothetical protein
MVFAMTTADKAQIAVALGTFVLATTTGLLALLTYLILRKAQAEVDATKAAVSAAQQQAEASRDLLAIESRPLLADVPYGTALASKSVVDFRHGQRWETSEGGDIWVRTPGAWVQVSVPIGNIGRGVAIVTGVRLHDIPTTAQVDGTWTRMAVPPTGMSRLIFSFEVDDGRTALLAEATTSLRRFGVTVDYTDIAGAPPYYQTFLEIGQNQADIWVVERVTFSPNAE